MATYTGNTYLMKELNRSMILNYICKHGPISRADIAKKLGLSASTVTNLTKVLLEDNELIEVGEGESSGGRRPTLLQFNYQSGCVAGVYIGEVSIRIALADLKGQIMSEALLSTKKVTQERGIVDTIVNEIVRCLESKKVANANLKGVGIAVSGITDVNTGTVLYSKYIDNWRNFPLGEIMKKKLGVPVKVDNEIFMAALAERWLGKGQNLSNIVLVSIGVGIGTATMIDKKIYRGSHHSAGELGDMIISDSDFDNVDLSGSLEKAAGWKGIEKIGRKVVIEYPDSMIASLAEGDPEMVTPDTVFRAAKLKDQHALIIIEQTTKKLGVAIANLISILDPEIIVLTGEVLEVGELFIEPIRGQVEEIIPNPPPIEFSELGREAEVLGATKVAIDLVITKLNVSD